VRRKLEPVGEQRATLSASVVRGSQERPDAHHGQRVVNDIDEIVRFVRFDGWQHTHAGEREVKMALRKTLFKYRLHQDQELFDRAYGYIRQYY
jgi:hypothetical protein